ncbi:Aspartate-semialdehyde dehydrogenase [Jeotgalicoccus saudimassiliensis]|uniref:Aspartate-semialdehyde dehydrogenase n=1 Tax=Jeotgalicoccus saudimassiliensis TaxID=1461582 RepID=A0A078M6P7_9STAP|nr:aspartate-semialdehyde dehydrogenase [Jeotgalicoccus saudimassiliensis]CEA00341.1 Aspartate-semialdehyde dehydrogenase [Jeotgalicoccus saudimassiliensis]
MKLAIVGATGVVGTKMIEMVEQYKIPFDELVLFSSKRSSGSELKVNGEVYTVQELTEDRTKDGFDYVIMSAGGSTSEKFAPLFEAQGSIVIDNSSFWRMHDDIDLIVPEINTPSLNRKIIANPNCSTIQSVIALKPLYDAFGVKRVNYTTYQSVSGSGAGGIRDLEEGAKGAEPTTYPKPIYNNVIPQIDVFLDDGYTKEEVKMINETKKILGDDAIDVTATCVRVPVISSHSVQMNVTLNKETTEEEVRNSFKDIPHIVLMDDPANGVYPTPFEATDENEIYVGRIRKDPTMDNTFHVWCVGDNILKGAAQNTVQILKALLENK